MTVPSISITDLTSSDKIKEGSGIFDVLFRKVSNEVEGQFVKGYLKGSEYAEVYLGAVQATLQQSMQFLLSRDELNMKLQLLDLEKQAQAINLEKLKLEKEILVLNKDIVGLQKLEMDIKLDLMELEKITVGKQQTMLDKQIASEEQRKLNMAQELLQITAQKDLLVQQKANLLIESDKLTQEVGLVTNNKLIAAEQIGVVTESKNKTMSETSLLNAKLVTEQFQTSGTPGGLLGKQMELYQAQKDGFVKDALQKQAKIAGDIWSVARTTDPNALESALPLTLVEIGNMIKGAA
jgi:hypothetical protein